ncbi:hypothetical protein FNJ88_03810 [Chryseobacterium sp. SNU WT5]|uniref:hypothetical protein n=1 Tax=Chryseobacterium sp. SNU WT5 TaxID=2594269 RepID=UPI00117FD5E7|nr:hypothetical protein [Chryseobacterium sp. SNU WT5]QDP84716.1 hypothetical protein FNJ88_03810 [Chryseobacterium sp. SNU WT5]
MEKDKVQDKYKKITQELKKEKMDWDFEDFLEKTKQEEKTIPLVNKTKGGSIPKTFWMAASIVLLISVGLFFEYGNGRSASEKELLVQNEIVKAKDTFQQESNLAINQASDTLKVEPKKTISDSTATVEQKENDIMDQILPKRGRLNKNSRQRYANNETSRKANKKVQLDHSDYESNYVIINGQKIENEQEAIDLTKYSFRILSENVSKTMAQTDVLNNFNNDY